VKGYLKFSEKDGHTEDKCFSLKRAERKLKAARIIEVQEVNNQHSDNFSPSKNLS
jgi:hypothetical protein